MGRSVFKTKKPAATSRVREAGITCSKCGRFQRSRFSAQFQESNDSIAGNGSTKKEYVMLAAVS